MAAEVIEGATDAGAWSPNGLPVTWRICTIGSPGLRDSGHIAARSAQNGLRYPSALTERERQVVSFVAAGRSNREIAGRLAIAESTVKRHLANVYRKLEFRSRSQVARWAIAQGVAEGPVGRV